jgi:hypothetical protein
MMMTGTQVAREHARYPELDSLDTTSKTLTTLPLHVSCPIDVLYQSIRL